MAWVDFRKVYNLVSHAWMIKALKLMELASNAIALLKSAMIDWETKLISRNINLGEANINRVIFL